MQQLTLAADIDGTLLGGTPDAMKSLRVGFARRRRWRLILATGRGLPTILPLIENREIPPADYIIGDLGATVVQGDTLAPVQPLQDEIMQRWPGAETVRWALRNFTGLIPQQVPMSGRCSFLTSRKAVTRALHRAVASIGCDAIFSNGRFLDVVPSGVSKGSTLRALLEREGIAADSVVVAGDTLNDLSLFQIDLKGVIVGNAERDLVRKASRRDGIYLARREGAGGILEGLRHHRFLNGARGG